MDVFAYLRNMAPDGTVETVTRGILQVSHRKLDPLLSTPYRPYHTHDDEQKLTPGESRADRSGDLGDEHGFRGRTSNSPRRERPRWAALLRCLQPRQQQYLHGRRARFVRDSAVHPGGVSRISWSLLRGGQEGGGDSVSG